MSLLTSLSNIVCKHKRKIFKAIMIFILDNTQVTMDEIQDTDCLGEDIEDPTKLQPFDVIIHKLIQEFESNGSLFDEVVKMSQVQFGQIEQQSIQPAQYFEILQVFV